MEQLLKLTAETRCQMDLPPKHQPGRAVGHHLAHRGLWLTSTKAGWCKHLRIIKVWPSRAA